MRVNIRKVPPEGADIVARSLRITTGKEGEDTLHSRQGVWHKEAWFGVW